MKPTYEFNGVSISKTKIIALVGKKTFEAILEDAKEAYLKDPDDYVAYDIGYGNLHIEFEDEQH